MRTKLILLTAWYPSKVGDGNFVRNEIAELAAAFDEVVIFNNSAEANSQDLPLPGNVRYAGNLASLQSRKRLILGLLTPRVFFRLIAAFFNEARSGELRGNFATFVQYSLAGIELSTDPRLRAELSDRSAVSTVYSFWGVGAAFALPWLPRVPGGIAVRVNGYDLYKEVLGYLPLRPALFDAVQRIVVFAEFGRRYLLRTYPSLRVSKKIYVGRLGTTEHEYKPRPNRQAERTIVSCSSLLPVKRVHKIVAALPLIKTEGKLRWIHFGGGELEADIQEAVKTIGDRVEVELRGHTDNAEIMEFYRNNRVDVFVNVSSSEGVPVSVMEALSYGIPVVATDVGGTGEIVGAKLRSGELLPADVSDQDLAASLTRMLAAPDKQFDSRSVWERYSNGRTNSKQLAAELLAMTES